MKELLKTAYTLWCLLLMAVFCILVCAALLALVYGWSGDNDNLVYASLLCIASFGWGASRYSKIFTDRVEKTKQTALSEEGDDDERDDSPF